MHNGVTRGLGGKRCRGVKCNPHGVDIPFLPRDAMYKRGLCRHAVSVRLSVCPSVTFMDHVKTNKHVFEIFFTVG